MEGDRLAVLDRLFDQRQHQVVIIDHIIILGAVKLDPIKSISFQALPDVGAGPFAAQARVGPTKGDEPPGVGLVGRVNRLIFRLNIFIIGRLEPDQGLIHARPVHLVDQLSRQERNSVEFL